MKSNFQAGVVLILMACAGGGFALGEEYQSYFSPTDPKPPAQSTASPSDLLSSPAGSECHCGACNECCGLFDECEDCSCRGLFVFTGFDSWRGVADGSFQNNNGMHTGVNVGGPIPMLEEAGVGWQIGGSFGIYDWNGRISSPAENAQSAQQLFFTTGLFRRANESSAWSGGFALDQMVANNFGVFSNEPYLLQFRYQIAYAVSQRNELGFWGTNELNQARQTIGATTFATRAVNQANLFWHHKCDFGADAWFYFGLPMNGRVGGAGTLGDFITGAMFNVPLSDRWSAYGNFAYLNPTAAVPQASLEDSWNVSIGLAWYPGRNARSRTVAGRTWMPYLPVANNGTFLIDQNLTF